MEWARTITVATCGAALVVFAGVQDRVTASGARQYVTLQSAVLAGSGAPVTIDQVMVPVVAESVRRGLMWSGAVVVAGLTLSGVCTWRRRRE